MIDGTMKFTLFSSFGLVLAAVVSCAPVEERAAADGVAEGASRTVRVALFNIWELKTDKLLDLDEEGRGQHPQVVAAARIVGRVDPDILIINEIDHDYENADDLALNARRFRDMYLQPHGGIEGLDFAFAAPNNTGILTGLDVDGDGVVATEEDRGTRVHGNDCYGYGSYPGEYSMAVLSRYPLVADELRSFQKLLWKDLPGHHMPAGHLSAEAEAVFRLSSKSHWDLPVEVDGRRLRLLLSHPTPQGFDGEEDKNGRRNFDEIKLWADYLDDSLALVDDQGRTGGYDSSDPFVVAGDLNAAPLVEGREGRGPFRVSVYDDKAAIDQLLGHPRVQDSGSFAVSGGGLAHGAEVAPAPGPPFHAERSTSVFGPGARIDYVLPSRDLKIVAGGVFWPTVEEDAEANAWADEASDHRLVWLDLEIGSPPD